MGLGLWRLARHCFFEQGNNLRVQGTVLAFGKRTYAVTQHGRQTNKQVHQLFSHSDSIRHFAFTSLYW